MAVCMVYLRSCVLSDYWGRWGGVNSWAGYAEEWDAHKPRNCHFPESLMAKGKEEAKNKKGKRYIGRQCVNGCAECRYFRKEVESSNSSQAKFNHETGRWEGDWKCYDEILTKMGRSKLVSGT